VITDVWMAPEGNIWHKQEKFFSEGFKEIILKAHQANSSLIIFTNGVWYKENTPHIKDIKIIQKGMKGMDLLVEKVNELLKRKGTIIKKEQIPLSELEKLAKPDLHPMSPFEKEIIKSKSISERKLLIQFKLLHSLIKEDRLKSFPKKQMNEIMMVYKDICDKLDLIKKETTLKSKKRFKTKKTMLKLKPRIR
jgi:hypothetical protein